MKRPEIILKFKSSLYRHETRQCFKYSACINSILRKYVIILIIKMKKPSVEKSFCSRSHSSLVSDLYDLNSSKLVPEPVISLLFCMLDTAEERIREMGDLRKQHQMRIKIANVDKMLLHERQTEKSCILLIVLKEVYQCKRERITCSFRLQIFQD